MMAILMLVIAMSTLLTGAFKAARRMHETLLRYFVTPPPIVPPFVSFTHFPLVVRSMLRVPMWVYDTTPIGKPSIQVIACVVFFLRSLTG
jgi:hypothetical protein